MEALIAILILVFICAISWAVTVGIIKLITMCFGLPFSLLAATGIWLIMILLKSIFNVTVNNKK